MPCSIARFLLCSALLQCKLQSFSLSAIQQWRWVMFPHCGLTYRRNLGILPLTIIPLMKWFVFHRNVFIVKPLVTSVCLRWWVIQCINHEWPSPHTGQHADTLISCSAYRCTEASGISVTFVPWVKRTVGVLILAVKKKKKKSHRGGPQVQESKKKKKRRKAISTHHTAVNVLPEKEWALTSGQPCNVSFSITSTSAVCFHSSF